MTDTKAVATGEGWLYLAVIVDLFSRMVVGWAMAATEDEQLVELALRMAVVKRIHRQGFCIIPIAAANVPAIAI